MANPCSIRLRLGIATTLLSAVLCASLHAQSLPPAADAPPPRKAAPGKPAPAKSAIVQKAAPPPRAAAAAPAPPAPKPPLQPAVRELHIVATIDATQNWKKNDPEYPGDQWSKGSTQQRYEIRTRLRTDGKLQVRNLLDPDITKRMEAKTIWLARQAKKQFEAEGKPFVLPRTPEEKQALSNKMFQENVACDGEHTCVTDVHMKYAAIFAAMEYPQALEPDTEPGRYLYFTPYKGCPEISRVQLSMTIDGVRYNKSSDEFVPFQERHSADTINASDGLALCRHFLAVIDTQDKNKPMYQETIFVPRPVGVTEYTENDHTSRETQPQPLVMAVVDWMGIQMRQQKLQGQLKAELPLALPLNQNATWLGLWNGTAKVTLQWSFKEVPAAPASAKPAKP